MNVNIPSIRADKIESYSHKTFISILVDCLMIGEYKHLPEEKVRETVEKYMFSRNIYSEECKVNNNFYSLRQGIVNDFVKKGLLKLI